jgi:hypothetical protein
MTNEMAATGKGPQWSSASQLCRPSDRRSSYSRFASLAHRSPPPRRAFSQLKAHLRRAAERITPTHWDPIGQRLDEITRQACANHFAETGHAAS